MVTKHLTGLIAAPFTPMNASGDILPEMIPAYYEWLKYNGVSGVFICGSTGEGPSLTTSEKMAVNRAWALLTRKDPDFFAMTLVGGCSLRECKDIAREAAADGIDGISFTAPYYFTPSSATVLAECCAEVAAAVPEIPFYYYHIPVLTGVNIPMFDLIRELDGQVKNFTGVKYTHEDFMDYQSCLNYKDNKFDMLWGRDENMLAALALGARAAVGSTYNYAAPVYLKMIDAYEKGDMDSARILQQQAIEMIRLLGKYGGIATGKAFMKLAGFDCGQFRHPVRNMNDVAFSSFQLDAAAVGFDSIRSQMPPLHVA